jgi:DNA-binding protein H-NS
MARGGNGLDDLSYAELTAMEARIERLKVAKRHAEREDLRERIAAMVEGAGLEMRDIFGKGRRGGTVAVKYRDPANPANTWTGRGRMPRWMVAATKGGRKRKEDFRV